MVDAYVTCSLGLPRGLRSTGHAGSSIDASYLEQPEMLLAANANVAVLDILGDTREKLYMIKPEGRTETPSVVETRQLQEFDRALLRWQQNYPTFAQATDNNLATCTK